jgi:hypothetical protein
VFSVAGKDQNTEVTEKKVDLARLFSVLNEPPEDLYAN